MNLMGSLEIFKMRKKDCKVSLKTLRTGTTALKDDS
jgi:hypothetical protein